MSKIKIIFLGCGICMLALFSASCNRKATPTKTDAAATTNAASKTDADYIKEGYFKATVTDLTGLDGCKFVLQLETGNRLEPDKLSEEFKKDKLDVWIKYSIDKNSVSICMVGQKVLIHQIMLRK